MSTETAIKRDRAPFGSASPFGSRWVLVLSALLLLQVAATAFVYWYTSRAGETGGGPLLAGLEPGQVQSVVISEGAGRSLAMARQGSGWVLSTAGDYPVKAEKVDSLLEKIAALQRDRLVGTQSTTLAELSVADEQFTRRIELGLADGSSHTLFVGAGPNFRTSHVRLAGEDRAYLSLSFPADDSAVRMGDWIDVGYVRVAEANIQRFLLENGNGRFEFFRDEQGQWQMGELAEGELFNSNNLISLLTSLSSLNMAEPLGRESKPEYGLDNPAVRVSFEYTDPQGNPKTAELRIGGLDASGVYYVVSYSESPYIVHISKFTLDRFVERAREEFLQQPPTPTPAP